MIYHVLAGDAVADQFKKTGIEGEPIVCRECLIVGPVDAETPLEFWDERAKFILAEYGEDEIEFHERVADELERLADVGAEDEVNLWFEYELFCSANMWFCLSLLRHSTAKIYRVEPAVRSVEDRWKGFGQLEAEDLKRCFDARTLLTKEDVELGNELWQAFRRNDRDKLAEFSSAVSGAFPYLGEVCVAAIDKEKKAERILIEVMADGHSEFADIFVEFSKRAGVFGFGDLQVQRMHDQISP